MKLIVYMQATVSAVLIFTAIFIAWRLLTAKYPTHSDVFWIGAEFGPHNNVLHLPTFWLFSAFTFSNTVASPK
jgi:hypothetical protein